MEIVQISQDCLFCRDKTLFVRDSEFRRVIFFRVKQIKKKIGLRFLVMHWMDLMMISPKMRVQETTQKLKEWKTSLNLSRVENRVD